MEVIVENTEFPPLSPFSGPAGVGAPPPPAPIEIGKLVHERILKVLLASVL